MTYRQLQAELKALKSAGHAVPKLNSKKEILEAAYAALTAPAPAPESEEVDEVIFTLAANGGDLDKLTMKELRHLASLRGMANAATATRRAINKFMD